MFLSSLMALAIASATLGPTAATSTTPSIADYAAIKIPMSEDGVSFAPDGKRVAMSYCVPPEQSTMGNDRPFGFTKTGVPMSMGDCEFHLVVYHLSHSSATELSAPGRSSWGASWSHDGRTLAYYSDSDGYAGVWLWNPETGRSRRLGTVQPRPFWLHQRILWSPDDRHLYLKTVSAAGPDPRILGSDRFFSPAVGGHPPLVVYRNFAGTTPAQGIDANVARDLADFAEVDVGTGAARVLIHGKAIGGYVMSRDGQNLYYGELLPVVSDYSHRKWNIHRVAVSTGEDRVIEKDAALEYGNEIALSPDGTQLALTSLRDGRRWVDFVATDGSGRVRTGDIAGGEADAPLWTADSQQVLLLGDGAIRRGSPESDALSLLWQSPDWRVLRLYGGADSIHDRVLALLINEKGTKEMVARIDLASNHMSPIFRTSKLSLSGSVSGPDMSADGKIVLLGGPARTPENWWLLDRGAARSLSQLNPALEAQTYQTRSVKWTYDGGKTAFATVMLPGDWKRGHPMPTVVWIYPGSTPSKRALRYNFGWTQPSINFAFYLSIGYAVLAVDGPYDGPTVAKDVRRDLEAAIDAAASAGYVDSDRLALRGQSFGALAVWNAIVADHRFKAAISTGNVLGPDLISSYLQMLPDGTSASIDYFESGQADFGTLWEHPEHYLSNSPVFAFDKITTPLLLGQGTADADRFNASADAAYVALRRLGKTVEYRLYRDESHVIFSQAAARDFLRAEKAWLNRYVVNAGYSEE